MMLPKRVAMLSMHTSPVARLGGKETGGMNVYVRELARALAVRGIAVDIFTRAGDSHSPFIDTASLGVENARVINIPAGPRAPVSKHRLIEYVTPFARGIADFAAAENQFRTALSINPKARNVRATLGDIALVRGDLNAARSHFSEEGDRASRFRGLAIVEMKLGRAAEAEAAYAELLREGGDTVHYQQAQVLAQWGRKDDALKELEQALALRDAGLVRLRNDPLLDPVREDARFAKIEQTIGFV